MKHDLVFLALALITGALMFIQAATRAPAKKMKQKILSPKIMNLNLVLKAAIKLQVVINIQKMAPPSSF